MAKHPSCSIKKVGKQRNGRPRFWCSTHRASATGRYGARLSECEAAYREVPQNVLTLDPQDFPGGLALWGAVAPVFDTTQLIPETGIHVHARRHGSVKEIDGTFEAIRIRQRNLPELKEALITAEAAVSYYISRFVGREIKQLRCSHCGELHLDKDFFAVRPHRTHLCHGCGKYFRDDRKAVSNPIAVLRDIYALPNTGKPVRPDRPLQIRQGDFPSGIQIWASNPALVWTSERSEEEGLHIHAFVIAGQYALDETYSSVEIDGIQLDERQIQYLMAQSALPYLSNKITALRCPSCSEAHFDQGDAAFFPHAQHECESCGHEFRSPGRRKLVVSNPFIETRDKLLSMSAANGIYQGRTS